MNDEGPAEWQVLFAVWETFPKSLYHKNAPRGCTRR